MALNVIFDMDGVLIDSEIHWKLIQSDFLKELIPSWTEQDQAQLVGLSAHHVYERLVTHYGMSLSIDEYFFHYKDITAEIYGERCNMLPKVYDLLQHLRKNKVPMSLASSSPHQWIKIVLDRFELRPFFQHIVSADDLGGVGKPDPGIYLKTASLMNVQPNDCLAIEDSTKGVASAVAAGMVCVGIRNGFNEHQDLSKTHDIITGFDAVDKGYLSKTLEANRIH